VLGKRIVDTFRAHASLLSFRTPRQSYVKTNMTSVSDAKVLGGIGSILVLLVAVPSIGWLLGIAGFIMTLIAVDRISKAVSDKKIYDNMLGAVILAIGAVGVAAVTIVGTIYHIIGLGSFVGSRFVLPAVVSGSTFFGIAALAIGGIIAVYALLVTSAVFLRRSYNSVGQKLNIRTFETAGLLYLIGAATAIVGVGLILIFIAEILLAVSFFSIPEQPTTPQVQTANIVG
jgi:uncharacterized membrane protein